MPERWKRIDVTRGHYSEIDLTLLSEDLARKCTWEVLNTVLQEVTASPFVVK